MNITSFGAARLVHTIWQRRDGSIFEIERLDGRYAWYWLASGSRPQFRSIEIERLNRRYRCVSPLRDDENTVWLVDDVGRCFHCGKSTHLLAGAGHTPLNAEANFVCWGVLDPDAIVREGIRGGE